MAVGVMASAELLLDSDPASVLPGFLEAVQRQANAAYRVQQSKKLLQKLIDREELRLKYHEKVDHLAKIVLGVFTVVGVTRGTLPPFTQVADLLEHLCDDLEAIASEKGGIGQMLYDKWCKAYKVLPLMHQVA